MRKRGEDDIDVTGIQTRLEGHVEGAPGDDVTEATSGMGPSQQPAYLDLRMGGEQLDALDTDVAGGAGDGGAEGRAGCHRVFIPD